MSTPDPLDWFERLYVDIEDGKATAPWDRGGPNPLLVEWAEARQLDGTGRRAIVVGSGLGDDAEHFAARGFDTVAFDLAATAVQLARRRFPGSPVDYRVANLLEAPAEWRGAFDLVVESITVQSMPPELHAPGIEAVAALVAPGGTLLLYSGGREEGEAVDGPPWPLTRAEIEAFATGGLEPVRIEELRSDGFRWRAEFARP
jgi:SAM-dependent methyltransferase